MGFHVEILNYFHILSFLNKKKAKEGVRKKKCTLKNEEMVVCNVLKKKTLFYAKGGDVSCSAP